MQYAFDQLVDKRGSGNMKYLRTPRTVKDAKAITYSGAEMDFPTAPAVISALRSRAESGLYGYTLPDEAYISALINWMSRQRDWQVKEEWIVPTYGTLHAINLAIRAFTRVGDGVIIQPPVYMQYSGSIHYNNRKQVDNPLQFIDGQYHMDFADLEKVMSNPSNKLMILCNPHNPIGKVWGEETLSHVAQLAHRHGVQVISDEIFGEIVFNGNRTIPFNEIEHGGDAIVCTSMGKTFNFTGFSHANLIIPSGEVREKMTVQRDREHYGSLNPFMRDALIAAYTGGAEWFDEMLQYVYKNYQVLKTFFAQRMPMVTPCRMEGTFLTWIDWSGLNLDDDELNRFLVEEAYLLTDRGTHYGAGGENFTRMNMATPLEQMKTSLDLLDYAARRRGF